MTFLVAHLIVYNDAPMLARTLDSKLQHADAIVAVDGRFAAVPGESVLSTDGTLELLEKAAVDYPGRVVVVKPDVPWVRETAARQECLEAARRAFGEDAWAIVVDADETLWVDRAGLEQALSSRPQALRVPYHERASRSGKAGWRNLVRAFPQARGVAYTARHWVLRTADGVASEDAAGYTESIRIEHHEASPERRERQRAYYTRKATEEPGDDAPREADSTEPASPWRRA